MLVLSRKIGESILIGENINIEITAIEGDRVYIGINAPWDVRIYRKELLQQTIDLNQMAVKASADLLFDRLQHKSNAKEADSEQPSS